MVDINGMMSEMHCFIPRPLHALKNRGIWYAKSRDLYREESRQFKNCVCVGRGEGGGVP